jgi:hypothetical protein
MNDDANSSSAGGDFKRSSSEVPNYEDSNHHDHMEDPSSNFDSESNSSDYFSETDVYRKLSIQ